MRWLSMAAVCACAAAMAVSCGWDKVDHGSSTLDAGLPGGGETDAGADSGQGEADGGDAGLLLDADGVGRIGRREIGQRRVILPAERYG